MTWLKAASCFIFGHAYFRIKKLEFDADKIGCHCCGKMWSMHHPTQSLLEWDTELAELHGEVSK